MQGRNDDRSDKLISTRAAGLTRRNWFELAGLAIAAAAIPSQVRAADTPTNQDEGPVQGTSPTIDKLSRYMSEARERALPDEVVEKAKQHTLDTLAAMISGSEIRPGRAAIEFARAYGGKEVATVVCTKIVCGPIEAALANGVLAHADETDDSHGPSSLSSRCLCRSCGAGGRRAVRHQWGTLLARGDTGLRCRDARDDEHGRSRLSGCDAQKHARHGGGFRGWRCGRLRSGS